MKIQEKHIQVICALCWCIVAAGPVFGFAALKPVLIAQGVYADKCQTKDACSNQDLALNFLFTLAAVVTNGASLFVGAVLDKHGPRFTGIIGAVLLFMASVVLAYSKVLYKYFDAYLIGYSMLALGGPFTFISCFQLANAFPDNSGLVLALLTGAFDSSSALFLVYRLIFFSSLGDKLNLTLSKFFTVYLVVPVFIFVCQWFIMPRNGYQNLVKADLETVPDEETALIDDETASIENYIPAPTVDPSSRPVGISRNESLTLLSSINENISRSLNSPTKNLLTDQFAQNRSNSFSQKVINSRRNSMYSAISARVSQEDLPEANDLADSIRHTIHQSLREAAASESAAATAAALSDSISVIEQTTTNTEVANKAGISTQLHGKSIKEQLRSTWFVLMALFTSIQMLRINYFVATIRSQEEFLLGNPVAAKKINEFFDVALPVGGLLSIPFIGALLDNFRTITVLTVLLSVSMCIGVCGMIPWAPANYVGIMLMVLYRPFYYTAVSDYCAKVFGFTTFGTVYGAIICISGFFNLVQTRLDHLTHFTFHMNPIPVNSLLTALTFVIGSSLIGYIWGQSKPKKDRSYTYGTF